MLTRRTYGYHSAEALIATTILALRQTLPTPTRTIMNTHLREQQLVPKAGGGARRRRELVDRVANLVGNDRRSFGHPANRPGSVATRPTGPSPLSVVRMHGRHRALRRVRCECLIPLPASRNPRTGASSRGRRPLATMPPCTQCTTLFTAGPGRRRWLWLMARPSGSLLTARWWRCTRRCYSPCYLATTIW
jgi:hypothetical protein